MMKEIKLYGQTSAGGALTVVAKESVFGYLHKLVWIDGTFDDGVGAVLSATQTPSGVDETLVTLTAANNDAVYYPRALVHGVDGAALTGTAGGDRTKMFVVGALKLVVSAGGNAKSGGCIAYVEEED